MALFLRRLYWVYVRFSMQMKDASLLSPFSNEEPMTAPIDQGYCLMQLLNSWIRLYQREEIILYLK